MRRIRDTNWYRIALQVILAGSLWGVIVSVVSEEARKPVPSAGFHVFQVVCPILVAISLAALAVLRSLDQIRDRDDDAAH